MNGTLHLVGKSLVDKPVPLDSRKPRKVRRDDDHVKVTATACRADMTGMQVAFIFDIDHGRRQAFAQNSFNPDSSVHGAILPYLVAGCAGTSMMEPRNLLNVQAASHTA